MSTSGFHSQPIQWILDWDGTITKQDTLDSLVGIAASTKPGFPTKQHWDRVTQAYINDYIETLEKLAPQGRLPKDLLSEKDLLLKLRDVEQRSLDRVSSSGIFAGLSGRQLDDGATTAIVDKQVQLRNGFKHFLDLVRRRQVRYEDTMCILSVNWSRRFITACLRAADAKINLMCTLSNELDGINEDMPSKGHIGAAEERVIISSGDKLRELERIRRQIAVSGRQAVIVYVGDSWTDIECLLAADLGICIRDEPMGSSQKKLAEALQRLGIACPHLKDFHDIGVQRVAWARDFEEIWEWIESNAPES
ncbi:hypothetical protein ACN47E_005021 [Coniothyrium glycines]